MHRPPAHPPLARVAPRARLCVRPALGWCLGWALLLLAGPAGAWNGASQGHVQWLTPEASASMSVTLVVTHQPGRRTQLVGTLPLPGPRGDGVVSMTIEAALIGAGRVSLPHPAVDLRYTEYTAGGELAFVSAGPDRGFIRYDAYPGGFDLTFEAGLEDTQAGSALWRQLSYTGTPLAPLNPEDLTGEPPETGDGVGYAAAVISPDTGCGSGYVDEYDDGYSDRRDPEGRPPREEDEDEDWRWDSSGTDVGSTSSTGCDGDDYEREAPGDSESGGCDDDAGGSEAAGSGCEGDSVDSGGGCDAGEASSGCDCAGDALASPGRARRSPWIARVVNWLPYFGAFAFVRLARSRRRARRDPAPPAGTEGADAGVAGGAGEASDGGAADA